MNRFFKQSKIKLYTSWQDYAFAILYFFTGNFFFKGSTNKLENFISKKFDKNCIALPQSRTGLYFVLKYYHKPGGNVIVSSYTVSVVINTIIVSGLKPIFVDIDKKSFNAKIDVIKKSINSKTVAIIATHFFGLDCEVEKIKKFSNKFKIPIIEDAAQAFGTKDAGLKGEVGLYSFGLLKNCTSFYGGVLVTDNDDLAKNIRKEISSLQIFPFFLLFKRIIFAFFIEIITNRKVFNLFIFPILKISYFKNINFINNFFKNEKNVKRFKKVPREFLYKISEFQSFLIKKKITKNHDIISRRIKNAELYYEGLKNIKELIITRKIKNLSHIYYYYPILFKNRDHLVNFMMKNNRDIMVSYNRNCADLECFLEFKKLCKNASIVSKSLIYLPTHPEYEVNQIKMNIKHINEYFKKR